MSEPLSTKLTNLEVIHVPIADIRDYENNPRINDQTVSGVAQSIQRFGFLQPVVVDKDRVIIVGHTRVKAAKLLGLDTVPIVIANNLTEEEIRAYRLLDNKLAEKSAWDLPKLTDELNLLSSFDFSCFDIAFDLGETVAPNEFDKVDEGLATDYQCPQCGYEWSGGKK